MSEKWQQISRETLFDNPYYRISHDRYRRPDGEIGDYYYVDIPGSTMVVPALADGRLVLVRQYRYLMARPSLEFPAGGLPRAPAILGTWIGGFSFSPIANVLFLSVGAGAVIQVVIVLGKHLSRGNTGGLTAPLNAVGVVAGLVLMYMTGLFVAA